MVVVYGEPQGKGRPRFTKRGNFVGTYTPKETLSYENLIKVEYREQGGEFFKDKELTCEIYAYFKIPKATSKIKTKLMEEKEIRPTKKPDVDNIAKIVLDALNGIAYKDDTQVVNLIVRKYYSNRPRIEINIY